MIGSTRGELGRREERFQFPKWGNEEGETEGLTGKLDILV